MRSGIYGIIATVFLCAPVLAYDWSTNPGDGSETNPYQLSEPDQLIALGSNSDISQGGFHFCLTNDIIFDPNTNPSHVFNQAVVPYFYGYLDGCGFSIQNLTITSAFGQNEFIALIGIGAREIRNLNINNASITVGDNAFQVGILCGRVGGFVRNCSVGGTITCGQGSSIGGICGVCEFSEITQCQADITPEGAADTGWGLDTCGGICGISSGSIITQCSTAGNFTASKFTFSGGICGMLIVGEIANSSSSINITADNYLEDAGGVCGKSTGRISRSYSTGNLTSHGGLRGVGGFCGGNFYEIDTCYSTGDIYYSVLTVNSMPGYELTGGFCGLNYVGQTQNCYSTGSIYCGPIDPGVETPTQWLGGFCGENGHHGLIQNCYSTGTVVTDANDKAGFCYQNGVEDGIVDCFWDTTTSGIGVGIFMGLDTTGALGKNTTQMKTQNTFTELPVNWEFVVEGANGENEFWRMCVDGVDYPRLSWEFARDGDFACGDGVDLADLQVLAEAWLTAAELTPTTFNYACDANGDEQIDLQDFGVLSENWHR